MSKELANCCGTTCDKSAIVDEMSKQQEIDRANALHTVNQLAKMSAERDALAAQLHSRPPKLIHLGFTTAGNAGLLTEHKRQASVFPDSNNDRWIPVYMLENHLHRVGYDSPLYCENDKMQREIKELKLELERQKIRGAALDAIRDFCLQSGIPPWRGSVVDSVIEEIKRLRGQVAAQRQEGE